MKKYGLEAEKEQFIKEYESVLDMEVPFTIHQVKELVVEVMSGTFDELQPAEVMQPVVDFIKKALKNSNIPFNWLTGEILDDIYKKRAVFEISKCVPKDVEFERLFLLNKINWTVEIDDGFPVEKEKRQDLIKSLITTFLLTRAAELYGDGGIPKSTEISFIDLDISKDKEGYICNIVVKYQDGKSLSGYRNVADILQFTKFSK